MGVVTPDISGSWNKDIENILDFVVNLLQCSCSISTQWVEETGHENAQKIKDKNNGAQRCH